MQRRPRVQWRQRRRATLVAAALRHAAGGNAGNCCTACKHAFAAQATWADRATLNWRDNGVSKSGVLVFCLTLRCINGVLLPVCANAARALRTCFKLHGILAIFGNGGDGRRAGVWRRCWRVSAAE